MVSVDEFMLTVGEFVLIVAGSLIDMLEGEVPLTASAYERPLRIMDVNKSLRRMRVGTDRADRVGRQMRPWRGRCGGATVVFPPSRTRSALHLVSSIKGEKRRRKKKKTHTLFF